MLWTAAHQAPLSTGFSRQEHWSGLPFPSPCTYTVGVYFRGWEGEVRVVEIRSNLSVKSHEGSSTMEKAGGQEEKEPKK